MLWAHPLLAYTGKRQREGGREREREREREV